jgi:signal peptidase II
MTTVWIVAIVLVIDQVTKYIVAGSAALQEMTVIPGFFHITYAENTGMAWSLLSGQQALLCFVAAIAIGFMLYILVTKKPRKLTAIGLDLIIGGAAGNLIDRLLFGYVRDFLHFYIFGYDFPIFNIADSALTIGVILLILSEIQEDHEKEAAKHGTDLEH